MEATLTPLLATTKQTQSTLSTQSSGLFSIDTSSSIERFSEKDSFSSMLKDKVSEKRESRESERNNLPSSGKDEATHAAKESETKLEQRDQLAKEQQDHKREQAEQDQTKQNAEERQSESSEKVKAREDADQEEPTEVHADSQEQSTESEGDAVALLEELTDGEMVDEIIPEEAVPLNQPSVEAAQVEVAEVMGVQQAAPQQAVTEEPVELDEALLEEEMLKRAANSEGRGRNPNLPPELQQKQDQQIHLGEEMDLKSAMNALKQQHASGDLGGQANGQGGEFGSGNSQSNLNGLFSAVDLQMSSERPVQLKGMSVTPQSRQWSSELGEKILFMAGKKIQSAEIRLNPPNLGLLEVKLAISGDQAQLVFQSGNANVRDVLESAVPKIREMLEQSGITLTDVNVSDRKKQESEQPGEERDRNAQGQLFGAGEGIDEEVVPISTMAVDRIGLVDYYI